MTTEPVRDQPGDVLSDTYKRLLNLNEHVGRMADLHDVPHLTLELVKIRASQINGCAFCTDLHVRRAQELGESTRRLAVLPTWRDTELFSEQERAALALAEATSRLALTQAVPDEVYAEAAQVFNSEQLAVVVWAAAVIQTFNVLNVTGRKPLPPD